MFNEGLRKRWLRLTGNHVLLLLLLLLLLLAVWHFQTLSHLEGYIYCIVWVRGHDKWNTLQTRKHQQNIWKKAVSHHLQQTFNNHKLIFMSYIYMFQRLLFRLKSSHISCIKSVVTSTYKSMSNNNMRTKYKRWKWLHWRSKNENSRLNRRKQLTQQSGVEHRRPNRSTSAEVRSVWMD